MDLNLRQKEIKYIKPVYRNIFTKEETAEVVVPDALPDIMRILDTDATVFLRSKEADGGKVTVTGIVNVSVIYIPDGVSGVRKMETNLQFSASAEEADITSESQIVASADLIYVDVKAINPRKIMARANLAIDVMCGNYSEFQVNTEAADDEKCEVEKQSKKVELNLAQEICEKTFIVSDEYKLPSAKPAISEILKTVVKLHAEDAKNVGSKIVFKGNADVLIYYRAETNELESAEFSTAFSQIIESDMEEDCINDISLMLTGVYVNTDLNSADEERNILLEVHAVAQCVTYCKRSAEYMCDAYSTQYALETECEEKEILSFEGRENAAELVRGTIETPSIVQNIIGANVHVGTVTTERTETGTALRCDVNAAVTFMAEDGRLLTCSKRFQAETMLQNTESVLYTSASCGSELYTSMSSDGVDLRLPIVFNVVKYTNERILNIIKLTYDEENPLDFSDRPSVVLKRIESGDTLWKLAKQYNSRPELIREANDIEDDYNLKIGKLLIIPKKR